MTPGLGGPAWEAALQPQLGPHRWKVLRSWGRALQACGVPGASLGAYRPRSLESDIRLVNNLSGWWLEVLKTLQPVSLLAPGLVFGLTVTVELRNSFGICGWTEGISFLEDLLGHGVSPRPKEPCPKQVPFK